MDRDMQHCKRVDLASQCSRPGNTVLQAALVGLATLGVVLIILVFKDGHAQDRPAGDVLAKLNLFQSWEKPDLVMVLTGEQHGYVQPCGCTKPQYGGLTRRYNLFQALWQRGWPTVAFDLGDIPSKDVGPQTLLKYRYSMMALEKMHYGAVSFGLMEMKLPLFDALAETLNHPSPKVLSANLIRKENQGAMYTGTVFDFELIKSKEKVKAPLVGVVGIGGKTLEGKDSTVQFAKETPEVLVNDLKIARKEGAALFVVLYQGSVADAKVCATWCQKQHLADSTIPRIDIILCLSEDPLPPARPLIVDDTQIVTVGHKGQYVGVIGVFRSTNPQRAYDLHYQLVHIDPEFETPEGKEKTNELNRLLEQYAREVKDDNYLAKYKQTDHELQVYFAKEKNRPEYVGSEKCQSCHQHAYKVWEKSEHARAYKTLVDAKNPSLRQYDGECVKCHTVGFGYKTGFQDEKTPPPSIADLKGVGCESCHGPASLHVAKPHNVQYSQALNKFKYRGNGPEPAAANVQRMNHMGDFCQKCHDMENDNHFAINKAWPKIEHMMSPGPAFANPGPQAAPPRKD
jgi:hypothetical protein